MENNKHFLGSKHEFFIWHFAYLDLQVFFTHFGCNVDYVLTICKFDFVDSISGYPISVCISIDDEASSWFIMCK